MRKSHESWTELTIDATSLTMIGNNAAKLDFSVDYDAGLLPQYTIRQDGNTKYSGVLMGSGFIDDNQLVFAVDLEGSSTPQAFHTTDGKSTKLTYRRNGVAEISASADEAYQAMEKLLANPKMDWNSTERYVATAATRMTSNIEFAKHVLDHFKRACAGC